MRRSSTFVTIAFLAGLGAGYIARSAGIGVSHRTHAHAADLAAIEKLHQEDIKVTLSQDPKGLLDIWTEDAVRFNPGNPPAVGKQAIQAENDKARAQFPGLKVLSYTAEYKDTQIEDGMACEWGEHKAQYKLSPETSAVDWDGKAFHVLRRQTDGSWKFAVLIGNE
jgi:ketosteroid isomerase-like protein